MKQHHLLALLVCCAVLFAAAGLAFAEDPAPLPDPSRIGKKSRDADNKNKAKTPAATPDAPGQESKPATHDTRLNSILEGLLELNKPPEPAAPSPGKGPPAASGAVQAALTLAKHELLFAYAAIGQVADLHIKEIYDRQWVLTMLATYAKTLAGGRAALESLANAGALLPEDKKKVEGLLPIYASLLEETQAYKNYAESGEKTYLISFSHRRQEVQAKIHELAGVKRPTGKE